MKTVVKFIVEKVVDGYTAHAPARSLTTEADSLKELNEQIQDALELQCEVTGEDLDSLQVELQYDLPAFFEAYSVVNVRALSERLGMNHTLMSQYMNGRKTPSPKQKARIIETIHQIGRELTQLAFA